MAVHSFRANQGTYQKPRKPQCTLVLTHYAMSTQASTPAPRLYQNGKGNGAGNHKSVIMLHTDSGLPYAIQVHPAYRLLTPTHQAEHDCRMLSIRWDFIAVMTIRLTPRFLSLPSLAALRRTRRDYDAEPAEKAVSRLDSRPSR